MDMNQIRPLYSQSFQINDFLSPSVLHEAEGHIVTVESTTGEVFRGKLIEAEDNMNLQVHEEPLPS